MRKGNRVCGASFLPLRLLQLKNLPPISSLSPRSWQPYARPTFYVRGILRISYGAGGGDRVGVTIMEEKMSKSGVQRKS